MRIGLDTLFSSRGGIYCNINHPIGIAQINLSFAFNYRAVVAFLQLP